MQSHQASRRPAISIQIQDMLSDEQMDRAVGAAAAFAAHIRQLPEILILQTVQGRLQLSPEQSRDIGQALEQFELDDDVNWQRATDKMRWLWEDFEIRSLRLLSVEQRRAYRQLIGDDGQDFPQ